MTRDTVISEASSRRGTRRRSERGAALLEAAIVLPIFVLFLFGIIDFGLALGTDQSVTHAAAEAARAAIGAQVIAADGTGPDAQCNAWVRVATATAQSAMAGATIAASMTTTPCAPSQMFVKVTVTSPAPVVLPLPGVLIPRSLTSTATVEVA